jgi:hypothetical protein
MDNKKETCINKAKGRMKATLCVKYLTLRLKNPTVPPKDYHEKYLLRHEVKSFENFSTTPIQTSPVPPKA